LSNGNDLRGTASSVKPPKDFNGINHRFTVILKDLSKLAVKNISPIKTLGDINRRPNFQKFELHDFLIPDLTFFRDKDDDADKGSIILEPDFKGKIYVNHMLVGNFNDRDEVLLYGYDFFWKSMPRDRNYVAPRKIKENSGRIWTRIITADPVKCERFLNDLFAVNFSERYYEVQAVQHFSEGALVILMKALILKYFPLHPHANAFKPRDVASALLLPRFVTSEEMASLKPRYDHQMVSRFIEAPSTLIKLFNRILLPFKDHCIALDNQFCSLPRAHLYNVDIAEDFKNLGSIQVIDVVSPVNFYYYPRDKLLLLNANWFMKGKAFVRPNNRNLFYNKMIFQIIPHIYADTDNFDIMGLFINNFRHRTTPPPETANSDVSQPSTQEKRDREDFEYVKLGKEVQLIQKDGEIVCKRKK
jgi:hypothetical protein